MRRVNHAVLIGCAILLILSANCSRQRTRIRVSSLSTQFSAPLIVAIEKGLFNDQSLLVTAEFYSSGHESLDKMFNDEADISFSSEYPIAFESVFRNDFGVIATVATSDNDTVVVGRRSSGIMRPEDLRGKRVAIIEGTSSQYSMHLFFIKNSIKEKDVKLILINEKDIVEVFNKKSADAIVAHEPFVQNCLNILGDDAIVFQENGLHVRTFNACAMKDYIQSHKGATERFLKAVIKAVDLINADTGNAERIVFQSGVIPISLRSISINYQFSVGLSQSLILIMDNEREWILLSTGHKPAVSGLDTIIVKEPLMSVKKESVFLY